MFVPFQVKPCEEVSNEDERMDFVVDVLTVEVEKQKEISTSLKKEKVSVPFSFPTVDIFKWKERF